MNEFLKKLLAKAAGFWADWSGRQKGLFIAVIAAVIVGIVMLFRVSATPVLAPVFTIPIRDETLRDRIVVRLNEEGVNPTVTPDGVIQVADPATAKRMKAILIREDLVPPNISPWQIFDTESWTITDFERNVKLQRSLTNTIVDHIKAVDGIDNVKVSIVWPKEELFISMQNPVTASVTIIPKPGSDITQNRKKIEGIQKTLKFAIEGLKDDNITITDNYGNQINDFDGMKDFDKQALTERQQKFLLDMEKRYKGIVLSSIQQVFTQDRVRDLNIKFEMDMSQKTVDTKENFPVTIKPRTPGLPYDDSIIKESLIVGEVNSDTKWEGTGFNPEGPGGVEGQTPPAFKDMSNLYGRMNQTTQNINYEINQRNSQEEKSPQIDRVTVSVNIDGVWKRKFDEKRNPVITAEGTIEREYVPVPPEELKKVEGLIRDAIGI